MNTVSLQEALRLAIQHHQSGRLPQAEALYRQILQTQPDHPDALHLLGVIALQVGSYDVSADLIGKALKAAPKSPEFHANLGEALRNQGKVTEAIASYRRAIQLNPRFPSAYNNLGIALKQLGRNEEAVAAYRRAIALNPTYFQALNNLAIVLKEQGKAEEAIQLYRQAIALQPDNAEARNNLGVALIEQGSLAEAHEQFLRALTLRPDFADAHEGQGSCLRRLGRHAEAIGAYQEAVRLNPGLASAWNNLGITLKERGNIPDAIAAYQHALSANPTLAEAHNNLGIVLKEQGALEKAAAHLQQAIAIKGDYAEAWNNLGLVLEVQGLVEEAVSAYRRALTLNPRLVRAASNVLFALNYLPGLSAQDIFDEHVRWGQTYAESLTPLPSDAPPPSQGADSRQHLRIGYVSPDFRQHPVAFFLESVLEHHDASQFEVFCYSDVTAPDDVTARLRNLAHQWRDISYLDDEQLCALIRQDRIDILIDLAGHTDRNRLLAFARRPAPVQISWIGYFNTTGMAAMDYFVTDVHSSPPEISQRYTEKLLRLPHSRFCYRPPDYAPSVVPPPSVSKGHITFGSFNNLAKINSEVVTLWAKILHTVPKSRLLLKSLAFGEENTCTHYRNLFAAHGIKADQLYFSGFSSHPDMLAQYGEIDIALDPFPFTGGMTSCEALWMGVPVVTLAGETLVSRQSASFLMNLGLGELIATTHPKYVEAAVGLANSPHRVAELRDHLRTRMASSPLCDTPGFMKGLEQFFRESAQKNGY